MSDHSPSSYGLSPISIVLSAILFIPDFRRSLRYARDEAIRYGQHLPPLNPDGGLSYLGLE